MSQAVATVKPKHQKATPKKPGPKGPIQSGVAYPVGYLNLGPWALRTAKENGFVVKHVNGRAMFMGEDYLAYMQSQPAAPMPPPRRNYKKPNA